MSLWEAFCGPSYTSRSATISADASINLYPETVRSLGPKAHVLYGTPGIKSYLTSAFTITRGNWSEDGRTMQIIGPTLYEVNTATMPVTLTVRGTLANDGQRCSMVSNGRGGNQLLVVSVGQVYIFNLLTNVLTGPVTLPLTNAAVKAVFMDGVFLLLEANTATVWRSDLENGLVWNPLNFFARSHTSDNLVSIEVLRDRLWTFGSLYTEVYYNSGDANDPFIPYPGSVIHEGCGATWGTCVLGEAVYWVAQNALGARKILRATSLEPEEITPPPIAFALASYSTVADAEVVPYTQEGHAYGCWTFPSAPHGETWCFDATESAWHQRQSWDITTGNDIRWKARCACACPAGILVGDALSGNLGLLDLDTFTEYGATRRWVRRAPYVSGENQWLFVDQIELACQAAVGLASGQGTLAQVMLRISRDAAQSWSNAVLVSLGTMGAAMNRAIWRKLGKVRADRLVIEISGTDPVRPVLGPGLWLRATAGAGLL